LQLGIKRVGWWNLLAALILTPCATSVGLNASGTLPHNEVTHQLMTTHRNLAFISFGLMLLLFLWRTLARGGWAVKFRWLYLIAALATAIVILTGGWYGGEMVYGHGLGIKPMMSTLGNEDHDGAGHYHHHEEGEDHDHDEAEPDSD